MRVAACAVLLAGLAAAVIPAHGTYMEAVLDPGADYSPFMMREVLIIHIDYPQNGILSEYLNGSYRVLAVKAGPEDSGVQQLAASLNDKIRSDGSRATVEGLVVEYAFRLHGGNSTTYMEFKVDLTGNITDYTMVADSGGALVDLGWRGLGSNQSITVDGVDINVPLNVLRDHSPCYTIWCGARYPRIIRRPMTGSAGHPIRRLAAKPSTRCG